MIILSVIYDEIFGNNFQYKKYINSLPIFYGFDIIVVIVFFFRHSFPVNIELLLKSKNSFMYYSYLHEIIFLACYLLK